MPWDAIDRDGQWVEVEDDVVRVVKEIERRYPELRVQYAEVADQISVAPYRVVEHTEGRDVEVFRCWALDDRLLEMLDQADVAKHGVEIMNKVDANNEAVRTTAATELRSWRELCTDIITHMSRAQGGTYTFKNPHTDEIVKVTDS